MASSPDPFRTVCGVSTIVELQLFDRQPIAPLFAMLTKRLDQFHLFVSLSYAGRIVPVS